MGDERAVDESVYLFGLRLGYYRGIGKPQSIGPFRKFNFFAGPNNAGKSTVLRFLHDYAPLLDANASREEQQRRKPGTGPEAHQGNDTSRCVFARGYSPSTIFSDLRSSARNSTQNSDIIEILAQLIEDISGDVMWHGDRLDPEQAECLRGLKPPERHALRSLTSLFGVVQQNELSKAVDVVRERIIQERVKEARMPRVLTIPAFRSVKSGDSDPSNREMDGTELIRELFGYMNHDIGEDDNRRKFDQINSFLQSVLRKDDAEIQIPASADKIIVKMDNKRLELKDLGTGIEEVIMIGAYCTINHASIICMEEPEIHLHPILQKRLLHYLRDHTDNQYFIATHSAALIDMKGASVFHVSNDGNATQISNLRTRSSRRLLTDELGYLPSDLVQSNCVIWVEGPSDRLYLLNWLEQLDASLIEGIHFSIMFYGGRLLSHLTGDAEKLDEFINLKSLNQHSAILIDSDRDVAGQNANPTKLRIRKEFEETGGVAWITRGREIENYLDREQLADAISQAHPKTVGELGSMGDYDNRLVFTHKTTGKSTTADKVKVAELMCARPLEMGILDLDARLKELLRFVRNANDLT